MVAVLNLVDYSNSMIDYKISKFPDGQQDITIIGFKNRTNSSLDFFLGVDCLIVSRFNSWLDLELIIAAKNALLNLEVNKISLKIPYLFSARSDRRFSEGGNSYLVEILSPILNAQNFHKIYTLDVHSDVASASIKKLKNETVLDQLLVEAFYEVNKDESSKCYVISPDSGASKRTFETCKRIAGFDFEIVECSKHRDLKTGNIVETIIPKDDFEKRDCVILDDIIDGGRTFIELAKQLKNKNCGDIYLCATHGIFSAGLEVFKPYIKQIFTTNSYQENKIDGNFVKYLNVFK